MQRQTTLIEGVVRQVDLVGRELDVNASGAAVRFDVPPGCPITLRGERVRFRLLQTQDRVRVAYTEARGRRVAEAIDVQPLGPTPR